MSYKKCFGLVNKHEYITLTATVKTQQCDSTMIIQSCANVLTVFYCNLGCVNNFRISIS